MLNSNHSAPSPLRPRAFQISTFRRFDFSTFPPKNRQIRNLPQHMPATTLANEKNRLCHYMSPSNLRIAAQEISPNKAPSNPHKRLAPVRAPNGAPACSHGCSAVGHSPTSATRGQHPRKNPTPAGVEESLECAQKNRRKVEAPQPMPATRLASAPKNFFRLLSPSVLQLLRATNEAARRSATVHRPTHASPCVTVFALTVAPSASQAPCLPNLDVSTFRLFDFSTFPRVIPTHARHKICNREIPAVSPYVTSGRALNSKDHWTILQIPPTKPERTCNRKALQNNALRQYCEVCIVKYWQILLSSWPSAILLMFGMC